MLIQKYLNKKKSFLTIDEIKKEINMSLVWISYIYFIEENQLELYVGTCLE